MALLGTDELLLIQMHEVSQVSLDAVTLFVGYDLCLLPKPLSSHHQIAHLAQGIVS